MNVAPGPKSVRRNACERCFGQKLRCTREHGSRSCVRCARLGAECVERPKRSMGRPRELSRVYQSTTDIPSTDTNSPRIKPAVHSSSSSDIDMAFSEYTGDDFVFTDFDAHHVELGSMDLGLDADLEDYWQSICKPHKDNSTRLPVDLIPQCISPLSVASENINNSRPLGIASEQTQSLLSTRQHLSNVNNQRSVTDCQNQPSKASAQRDTLIVDKDHSSSSPTTPLLSMKDAKIMTVQRLSQLQTSLLSLLGHAETVSNGTELSDRTLPFELLLSFRHSSGHSDGSDKRSTLTSHDFSKQSSLANHLQGLFAASQTFIMLVKKLQNAALSSLLNADQASISSQTSTPALKQIDPMSRLIVLACYTLLITMYEPFAQILQDQHAALDTIPCCTTNSKIAISKCGIQLDVKTVMLVQLTTYLVNGIDTATREYLWLVSRDPDSTNNHVEASLANGRSRRVSDNIESQDPGEAMCASMKELTVRRDDLRSKLRYCESVHIKSIDQMSL